MIKYIKIKNFQKQKDSCLEFVPGVNVIMGNTDSGKSSIVRALRYVLMNRPNNDQMISHMTPKAEGVEVSLVLHDGNQVIRFRNNKDNAYRLNEDTFKALRGDVPEEIKKVINANDINIQTQLEGAYLIHKSAGEIARYLNNVVDLDIIDRAVQKINRMSTETKQVLEALDKKQASLEKEKESCAWVSDAKPLLDAVLELEAKVKATEGFYQELWRKLQEFYHVEAQLAKVPPEVFFTALNNFENSRLSRLTKYEHKVDALGGLVKKLSDLQQALDNVCAAKITTETLMEKVHSQIKFCPTCKQVVEK